MSRTIKVSGHCQAPGIAEALRLLLPSDDVGFLHWPQLNDEPGKATFIEQIKTAEIWVTSVWDQAGKLGILSQNPEMRILKWPQISFPAFHPDITFAHTETHHITAAGCVYNSAICLWAWTHGVPIERVAGLFCGEVFKALGYLDAWDPSVAAMRAEFRGCDLDFDRFFQPVKRQGVFMHSNLHAKLSPMVHLTRQLAGKLGADKRVLDDPLEDFMADPLIFDAVWPVYPEIGDALGVPSCYRWKYRQTHCASLQSYIEASYASYEEQPIERAQVRCERFADGALDRILGRQLELQP